MMENFLEFARGPLFTATFLFMVLGLLRILVMQVMEMVRAWHLTQDHDVPIYKNLKEFITWSLPSKNTIRVKPFFSVCSFLFHIGLILVPIFFLSHIVLWERGLGVSWPGFNRPIADLFTALTIVTGLVLLAYRVFSSSFRALSGPLDYFILILLLVIFISGFVAAHPSLLFTSYNSMMLVHVLTGNLLFVLIPFTKLAHMILFPFGRLSSDFYWKLATEGPEKVAHVMRGEDLKV